MAPFIVGGVLVAFIGLILFACIFVFPTYLVERDVGNVSGLSPSELAHARNAVRTTLLQGLGAVFFVATAFFTWRQIVNSQDQLELTRQQLVVAQQGQITERFTRAIDQLGSDTSDVRLGGIYGLERIAKDSPLDHPTVLDVLKTYLRDKAGGGGEAACAATMPSDVQAVLAVIGRREITPQEPKSLLDFTQLDLSHGVFNNGIWERSSFRGSCLDAASFSGAHLDEADFREFEAAPRTGGAESYNPTVLSAAVFRRAELNGALFTGVDLTDADLQGAHLVGADLSDCRLVGVNLVDADLRGADLRRSIFHEVARVFTGAYSATDLTGADLRETDLRRTEVGASILRGADLRGADLRRADLRGADLTGSDFTGADLAKTDLRGADLRDVSGLTQIQLDAAITDSSTRTD